MRGAAQPGRAWRGVMWGFLLLCLCGMWSILWVRLDVMLRRRRAALRRSQRGGRGQVMTRVRCAVNAGVEGCAPLLCMVGVVGGVVCCCGAEGSVFQMRNGHGKTQGYSQGPNTPHTSNQIVGRLTRTGVWSLHGQSVVFVLWGKKERQHSRACHESTRG